MIMTDPIILDRIIAKERIEMRIHRDIQQKKRQNEFRLRSRRSISFEHLQLTRPASFTSTYLTSKKYLEDTIPFKELIPIIARQLIGYPKAPVLSLELNNSLFKMYMKKYSEEAKSSLKRILVGRQNK